MCHKQESIRKPQPGETAAPKLLDIIGSLVDRYLLTWGIFRNELQKWKQEKRLITWGRRVG